MIDSDDAAVVERDKNNESIIRRTQKKEIHPVFF